MAPSQALRLTQAMAPDGSDPRTPTTGALVDAALAELLAAGQADFAMERVARGAFFSVGSVYERWPDRELLLADIGRGPIASDLAEGIAAAPDTTSAIDWVLSAGNEQVLLGSEILLAGHTMPGVRASSLLVWEAVFGGLARRMPESIAWYVATYAIGNALLEVIGVPGPEPATGRTTWITDACIAEEAAPRIDTQTAPPVGVDVPEVPLPARSDPVAVALIGAAQMLLQERGVGGASTRDIAANAGVTTGAIYRRYEGKSRLLADVLLTQLEPDRYTWSWDLVTALASDDPYSGASDVIAARMIEVARDEAAQRVLLQVGIAARSDAHLQAQIAERIRIANTARTDMVQHFIDAGLLRSDVSAGVFAWGFQTVPVGVRATLPLGIPLDRETVVDAMRALLAASAARA